MDGINEGVYAVYCYFLIGTKNYKQWSISYLLDYMLETEDTNLKPFFDYMVKELF